MTHPVVFHDRGWSTTFSFGQHVLVVCPRCAELAQVRRVIDAEQRTQDWRMTCLGCGLAKQAAAGRRVFDSGRHGHVADPVFRQPLWLQSECCGGKLLWAYNLEHLNVLESFIVAKLRHKGCLDCGRHHQRMIHKLPAWLKSAKHRDELLAAISKLRTSARTVAP